MVNIPIASTLPRTSIISGGEEYINQCKQELAKDFRFYARVLRIIYSKPRLRQQIIDIMHGIENTRFARVPKSKGMI